MATKALSEKKIVAILEDAISETELVTDGSLASEREEVMDYYRGDAPKQLHKGDSKYVSRDVYESVDSMRATVLESFMASTRIVNFRAENGETADDAKQATEYCRHVFFKDNQGEDVLYDALTEGLTKRFAVAKVYHERIEEEEEYEFEGATPEELSIQLAEYEDYDFTEVEVSENGLYTGTFTVPAGSSKVKVEVVQPEDFLISSRSANLEDCRYLAHRITKTRSDLLKEGYEKKLVEKINFSDSEDWDNYEKNRRFESVTDLGATDKAYDHGGHETSVYEFYIRMDVDGNGVQKLWKIVYADGVILERVQVSRMPFASFVPLPIPHTYLGDNFAQSAIPVQNARTVLIRQVINHSRITNNPRTQVMTGTVQNPQELLDNRLGGIVNVRRMDGMAPIPQQPLNPYVFNLIEKIDEDKEETTGISKLSQGMNKDAISTQNAEGMVEQLISASQQRQKIIARRFGKFIKEVYELIYHTAMDYVDETKIVQVSGVDAEVDPKQWEARSAASVELTLSYAELQREAQKWVEIDAKFSQDPQLRKQYTPEKRWEVLTRAAENQGIEDLEAILTPPDDMPEDKPTPMQQLEMAEKQAQIDQLKANAEAARLKAKTDQMNAQTKLLEAKTEAAKVSGESKRDMQRLAHEIELDTAEFAAAQAVDEEKKSSNFSVNPSG